MADARAGRGFLRPGGMIEAAEPRTPVTVVTGPDHVAKAALLAHVALGRNIVVAAGQGGLVADQPRDAEAPFRLGCACCTVQGDLQRSLRTLLPRARRGDVSHVLVDASQGSDPLSVLTTLITDPVLAAVYRIGGVVAVVDGIPQDMAAERLIVLADRVIVMGSEAAAVRNVNPAAQVVEGLADAGFILRQDRFAPAAAATERVVTLTLPDPVDWDILAGRLRMSVLNASSGPGVQRLSGVLQVAGEPRPVAIDAVRHHLAPPRLLPAWPPGYTPVSRLVLTGEGLDAASIRAALADLAAESGLTGAEPPKV